uniref:Threonylcarbamoyl-AMP synthase n=1 Tax=Albugo laibachii Nc14 TaxID=890382 RepID=F0X0C3_9STRA|nr:conserved hypothetical protein [Albugo laibachii Nc14]|eukprot:CCA27207.1 conserved hypothetical protein [Albugo laibachii Nc14]
MAVLARFDAVALRDAAIQLKSGHLVAFPTETVYGLGANALDAEAVSLIFQAKGRPLTDPLIVHVAKAEDALPLIQLTAKGHKLFSILSEKFWPGPLTIIAPASDRIPPLVTANTGFVGVRCPAHPVALELLQAAKIPIAAPSANRFGHVSPTCAQHVMNDLGHCANLTVLDDSNEETSRVGIESTVIRIVPSMDQVWIYRRGGTSEDALSSVLQENQKQLEATYTVIVKANTTSESSAKNQEAPGQLLKHYAPDVETHLIQICSDSNQNCALLTAEFDLAECVILDVNRQLAPFEAKSLAYRDLSKDGDITKASQLIFEALRWSESVPKAKKVLMADIEHISHQHTAALRDRMFRAASGKVQKLKGATHQ